jgi:hypothetical protein
MRVPDFHLLIPLKDTRFGDGSLLAGKCWILGGGELDHLAGRISDVLSFLESL